MAIKDPRPVPTVNVNEPSPISGRIAWHIENAMVRFFKRVFNAIGNPIRSMLAYALEEFLDLIESQTSSIVNPYIDELLKRKNIPSSIRRMLESAKSPGNAAQWQVQLFALIGGILSLGKAFFDPYARLITYEGEIGALSHRPSPIDILLMQRLKAIDESETNRTLADIGVHSRYKLGYQALIENLMDDTSIINAWLRQDISDIDINELLRQKGYNPFSVETMKKLAHLIPGPQDLIRMAVREAWNDSVSNRFGHDEDFPAEFAEWAKKIGLDDYWTKKYWRAHWELPGVREGFELLHRRIITIDDVQLLLRSRDIPKFWREKLIKLSYNPYTRVDVRRMFSAGVIGVKEVYDTYRDLGYDDEHAQNLTDWTVLEYGQSSRDLTKADIIAAYEDNTISEQDTKSMLIDLGYDETEVAILLARANLRKQQRYDKEYTENVRIAFVGGHISVNDVYDRLNKINPPTGFIEERLSIWELQKERQLKRPAKSDLKAFLQSGIISTEEAAIELLRDGYQDYVVNWFIALWTGEV